MYQAKFIKQGNIKIFLVLIIIIHLVMKEIMIY